MTTDTPTRTTLRADYEIAREKAAVCREEWHALRRCAGPESEEAQAAAEVMHASYRVMRALYRQLRGWRSAS